MAIFILLLVVGIPAGLILGGKLADKFVIIYLFFSLI